MIVFISVAACKKEIIKVGLPYCAPKINESESIIIGQKYLEEKHTGKIVNTSKLTGCNNGISRYSLDVFYKDELVGKLEIDGNDGSIIQDTQNRILTE